MNKTITIAAALVLLNCFSYSMADELRNKKDYVQEVERKNLEIESLRKDLKQLEGQLEEKDKEIKRLRELCFKNGINIAEEKPVPIQKGKFKILDKPMFGICLGEHFTQLRKRFTIRPVNEQNEFRKSYLLTNVSSPNVKFISVMVCNNQVSALLVMLNDASNSNYEAILSQIKAKYKVLQEEEPISMDDEYSFKILVMVKKF